MIPNTSNHPRHRRRASFAVLFAAALAIAGCRDLTGALPQEGPPDDLQFSFGGFGIGSERVQLHGDSVVFTRESWTHEPGVSVQTVGRVPTADEWRAFWDAARHAGVQRWRGEYIANDVVDGVGWELRIESEGRTLESTGSNAYPDRLGREHELEMTGDFIAFRNALSALVGEEI